MKRLAAIFVSLILFSASVRAAFTIPQVDNSTFVLPGDSLFHDGDPTTGPQTGCMAPDYWASGLYSLNPQFTNVAWYNVGRSGTLMTDQAITIADQAYPYFAYNLFHGYGTNSIFNAMIEQATDNGNYTSNQMFLSYSNNFLALLTTTNSVANTNEGGTSATNLLVKIALADPPAANSSGGGFTAQSQFARSTAATNAGTLYGSGYIGSFDLLIAPYTNWVNAGDSPPLDYKQGVKAGHLTALGQLLWAFTWWMETTTDTNVSNITIDYNTLAMSNTNHSVGINASKSGASLTFTEHPFRVSPGWDIGGSVDWLGNVTTNDCSPFPNVWPAAGNFWQETITVTGLPSGMWKVYENGVLKGTISNTVLGNGWNIATNYIGPRWQQRVEILARCRDVENANRVTLSVATGAGFPLLGSLAFSKFPPQSGASYTGDALEAQMDSAISGVRTNSTGSFAAIAAASQGTNYTYLIVPATAIFAPFHR